ncbi:pentapeptide repeat-containing protein [Paracoccaceae bacterium]|nr:pentapeptide repeat-containing protein [Paracoccaceae bacterium]
MKLTLTALTVAATIFASSASAFDPDDLQKLKDTNECKACDLTGANLTGANLEGAILCDTTMPMKVGVFAKLRAFFGQEPQVYYINDSGC